MYHIVNTFKCTPLPAATEQQEVSGDAPALAMKSAGAAPAAQPGVNHTNFVAGSFDEWARVARCNAGASSQMSSANCAASGRPRAQHHDYSAQGTVVSIV